MNADVGTLRWSPCSAPPLRHTNGGCNVLFADGSVQTLFLKPNHKISFGGHRRGQYIDSDFKRYMLMIKWPNNGIYDSNAYRRSSHMRRQKRFRIHVAGAAGGDRRQRDADGRSATRNRQMRGRSQSISCQSNLQTLSTAFVQYNQEYMDRYPYGFVFNRQNAIGRPAGGENPINYITWFSSLDKYLTAGQRR
jgi:prepilin-type processing-associated H-X9-DG protein